MPSIKLEKRKQVVQKWISEKLSYRKLAKKFNISKSAVEKIIKKYGNECTFDNLRKSSSRSGPVNEKKEKQVVQLLMGNQMYSVRQIAKKVKLSVGTIQNIKKGIILRLIRSRKFPKEVQRNKYEPESAPADCIKFYFPKGNIVF